VADLPPTHTTRIRKGARGIKMAEALHQLATAYAKHAHHCVADVMPNYGGSRAVIGDPEPMGWDGTRHHHAPAAAGAADRLRTVNTMPTAAVQSKMGIEPRNP
jgi:hypothetical protein